MCNVIVRFAVVHGINFASNAGKKVVIVRGTAEHLHAVTCITSTINSKYYGKPTILLQINTFNSVEVSVVSLLCYWKRWGCVARATNEILEATLLTTVLSIHVFVGSCAELYRAVLLIY